MVTQNEIRAWFHYDASRGRLVRKDTAPYELRWHTMPVGYRHTNIRGKTYYETCDAVMGWPKFECRRS